MTERFITPTEITTKTGKKGDYLSVKATDGNTYNIFDGALFNVFEKGLAVRLEGEVSGKFFNTTHAEQVKNVFEKEAIEKVSAHTDNKNRSYALSYAKDIMCALIAKGETEKITDKVIATAKKFEEYLNS